MSALTRIGTATYALGHAGYAFGAAGPYAAYPASLPPIVLDEFSDQIRYGGPGTWEPQPFANYYDGVGKFNRTDGSWYETTLPAGYGRVVFEGIRDEAGATFDVHRNGQLAASGTQAGPGGQTVYFEMAGLEPGDIVRLTKTGGAALFADRITFYQS